MTASSGGEVQVSIGAAWSSGFSSAFSSADAQINQLGSTIRALDAQAAKVRGFDVMRAGAEDAERAWRESDQELRALSAHLAGLNEITDDQKRQFRELEKRTRSLRAAYEAQRATVDRTGAELREAGIDTNRLTSEQQRLETQLRQTNRQLAAMEKVTSAGIGTAFGNVRSELGSLATQAAVAGAAIGYTFKTQFLDGLDLRVRGENALRPEYRHRVLRETSGIRPGSDQRPARHPGRYVRRDGQGCDAGGRGDR